MNFLDFKVCGHHTIA